MSIQIQNHIQGLRGPILVMGASGFVGANLFQTLAKYRQDVYAVVQREKGWRLAGVNDKYVIAVDLNDGSAVKNLINSVSPKSIFDCVSYGAYSFEGDGDLIYRTNFLALTNFVNLLIGRDVAAYIHAGSSSEYGNNCTAPSEDALCEPNSDYAVSKIAAANYLNYVGKRHAFPAVNLRLYSVYGPLEDSSRLVPNLVKNALAGTFPPFVNKETTRDFVYVDDVCNAFILAASKMQPEFFGESFNIGTGAETSMEALANITSATFEVKSEPHFGKMESRKWDLAHWYANPSKAKQLLDWQATTKLEKGLLNTAQWVKTLSEEGFKQISKINLTDQKRSLSAIIACYKDAQAIPIMYERLTKTFKSLGIEYEIIFVNDCSPDNSYEVISQISEQDPHVIGINHSRNFGSQMAFRSGMEIATKQGVVLLDGDLQDPPELITQFYEQWVNGYDIVYGRRIKRDMPWYQGMLYKMFYRVFAAFSYINIPLDAGDFSLIDRRAATWMLQCQESDLFMRGIRAYVGFRQIGVDYVRPDRMFGVSTNSLIKNLDWAKKGIFSFSNTPLTMLTAVGILSLGFSFFFSLVVIFMRFISPETAPRGFTTMILVILVFGSFNIFAVGLVGEYVAKIMAEVKGRPRLIRTSLIRNGKVTELLPDGKI